MYQGALKFGDEFLTKRLVDKAAFGNGNGNDESDLENVKNRKFSKLTTETLVGNWCVLTYY